jgi:CP family cyanate transporter-like MFS transporter
LHKRLLPLFAVGLVLRPQIVGVGPLLPRIESSLHISHGVAGLLATIPVLCMGVFAPLAPPVLRRFGSRAAIGAPLLAAAAVGVLRAVLPGAPLVLLFTVPVGVGIAVAGTLLPVVVKEEYPARPTLGTGVYTTGINVGATIASVAAAPLAVLFGWRWTLVVYSLVSLVLVVPWLAPRAANGGPVFRLGDGGFAAAASSPRHAAASPPERAPLPLRVPLAWAIAGAFALQSILFYGFNAWLADAYTERGWSDTAAGGLVALMNGVALLVGIATALSADRFGSRRAFLLAGAGVCVAAGSLVAADVGGAWLWAALLGAGMGILFTIVMTLPLDAGRDRAEVAAYSTVMLGIGYAISSLAPTALGAVRDATGTFTAPLSILAVDALLLFLLSAGIRIASSRPRAAY